MRREATHLQNDQIKKILSGDCDNKVDQKRLKQLDMSRNRASLVFFIVTIALQGWAGLYTPSRSRNGFVLDNHFAGYSRTMVASLWPTWKSQAPKHRALTLTTGEDILFTEDRLQSLWSPQVELLRLVSALPPYAPLRHLDLRENCENNGIAEEKVLIIRAALLLTWS